MIPCRTILAAALAVLLATPAQAELPSGVRAMIDAAVATGDAAKVATVIELAKQTHPGDSAAIEALESAFAGEQAERAKAQAAAREAEIRSAGLFAEWSGKGEVGAFRSTGNSNDSGMTGAITLTRAGIDWTHKLTARADYQRSSGTTSREKYFAAFEPHYQMSERAFAYGLTQYERDRFQGFSARYAVSGGFGYQVIDAKDVDLSIKAGPAFRVTRFVEGGSQSRVAGLFGLDFDWRITDRITLTEDARAVAETGGAAVVIVDSSNTTLSLVTGLEAKVGERLSTRLSYTVDYDSSPPAGSARTDTRSRFSLVYGF